MILLACCSTLDLDTTPIETPIPTAPSPMPLPVWLREVRPFPASNLTQNEYRTVLGSKYMQEGPPPPAVEETGFRSSVCVHLDVQTLVEPGDLLFWDEDVMRRMELIVDGKTLAERAPTDYLA